MKPSVEMLAFDNTFNVGKFLKIMHAVTFGLWPNLATLLRSTWHCYGEGRFNPAVKQNYDVQ